jgi:hypothetical protein
MITSYARHLPQTIGGYFREWAGPTQSEKNNLLKIIGIATVLLGIVGIVFKLYKSRQVDLHNSTTRVKPLSPATPARKAISCQPYNTVSWNKLSERVYVTEEDLQSFLNYHYESEDKTDHVAHATNIHFFYSNCDKDLDGGSNDLGWGCAWRSIQTCLSHYPLFYTFDSLYQAYRVDPNCPNEWAEPGYGYRVCSRNNIMSCLYLYQREVGTSKTATNSCSKIENFEEFVNKLIDHFHRFKTPVMVDDATYAYSILGIKTTEKGDVILWIADPHKTSLKDGLYYLVLDNDGKKKSVTGIDNGENGLESAQKIDPNKGWILLCPKGKIISRKKD